MEKKGKQFETNTVIVTPNMSPFCIAEIFSQDGNKKHGLFGFRLSEASGRRVLTILCRELDVAWTMFRASSIFCCLGDMVFQHKIESLKFWATWANFDHEMNNAEARDTEFSQGFYIRNPRR